MSENIGAKFIYNKQLVDGSEFVHTYVDSSPSVYEVIRIMDGIPLFLEEHYQRLLHSAKLLNHKLELSSESMKSEILRLAKENRIKNNNVKIVINNLSSKDFNEYYFLIKSNYPEKELYVKGVPSMTFHAVRKNPNAKIIYQEMRDTINRQLKDTGNYEALLVNESNEVTEGSRSNLFFTKEHVIAAKDAMQSCSTGKIYTAPASDVLIGVTRKKIIALCKANGLEVVEAPISLDAIKSFDSCFISGTSPKILPLNQIDGHPFSTSSPLLRRVIALYEEEIQQYIQSHS